MIPPASRVRKSDCTLINMNNMLSTSNSYNSSWHKGGEQQDDKSLLCLSAPLAYDSSFVCHSINLLVCQISYLHEG